MIRVFEAFAGIGGFRSALEKTGGFEIVGWCEINHFAQKAYRLLFDTGKEEFYEDITKIDYGTMPDFDLRRGKATESSLKRFANWGIVCAGVCLTAQISESPRTGKECILSDILEKEVPPKYWLSEKAAMKIAMTAEKKQS